MLVSPLLFRLFGRLPAGWASAIGAWLGPRLAPRQMPVRAERARRNLAVLRPDLDDAARSALLAARWRNLGRFYCELPVMAKLNRKGRTQTADAAAFTATIATSRPIVFVSVHLGNWELLGAHLVSWIGRNGFGIYEPPADPVQAALLDRVRRSYITSMIAPGAGAARRIVKALATTSSAGLYMLLDERRDYQVHFPFFGRPPQITGNLSIALRIAAATRALIVPVHMAREPKGMFRLHWGPPIDVAETGAEAAAAALNAHFEPLVLANLDHWLALQDMALD